MIHDPNHPINQMPAHLQPGHWTRHLLLGRGIVCGLTVKVLDDCTFRLCGGLGVTSDGTLAVTPKKQYHFTHYRPFTPPAYPLFLDEEGEFYPVWEVLEGRPAGVGQDVRPLTPQNEEEELNLFLRDKALLLFLEEPRPADTTVERKPGSPEEGEEPGQGESIAVYRSRGSAGPEEPATGPMEGPASEIPYHLRWLVMRQADVAAHLGLTERLAQIVARRQGGEDYVYSEAYSNLDEQAFETDLYQAENQRLDWPEIPLRRFGFGCLDPFDCEPEDLDASEFPHIQTLNDIYEQYVCIVDAATKALDRESKRLQNWLIDHFYCFSEPEWEEWRMQLCQKWEAFKALNQLADSSRHRKENAQYFYDWCRDLLAAYHELRREVLDWRAECCPDAGAHPRHLLLGLVMRNAEAYFPLPLRHHYLQPPVYNEMAARAERIRLYHRRFLLMIRNFYLPYSIPDDTINPYCVHEEAGEEEELPAMNVVKVTPGRYYDQPLGQQSVPYYYPLTESRFSVHRFWDDFRSRTLRIANHRSYHARLEDGSYSLLPNATHPLRYNIDTDGFFRIEGHIGLQKPDVEPVLEKWRRKYNLSFDVVYRQINNLTEEAVALDGETFNTFQAALQGAEHLAGVVAGGAFIVVYDGSGKVVADFSLPYRCCPEESPPPPPPPPVSERDVRGLVMDCNEQPLPGITVLVGDKSAATDLDGRYLSSLTPGDYILKIENGQYLPYVQEFTLTTDDDPLGLEDIILIPRAITIFGRLRRGDTALSDVLVAVILPNGARIDDITDTKGEFTLANVPREVNSVTYFLNDEGTQYPLPEEEPCDSVQIDINISDITPQPIPIPQPVPQPGPRPPLVWDRNIPELIGPEYYAALDISPNSEEGRGIAGFYESRFRQYAENYNAAAGAPRASDKSSLTEVESSFNKLLNDPGLNTNQIHAAYKSANKALDEGLRTAGPEEKKPLLAVAENLTMLYLDRIALSQPEKVTPGTINALSEAGKIGGGAVKIGKITTDWSKGISNKVNPAIADTLRKFKP